VDGSASEPGPSSVFDIGNVGSPSFTIKYSVFQMDLVIHYHKIGATEELISP
jgi:hypothetical protein